MNKWKYALMLLAVQVLQATWLSRMPIFRAQVNLVLALVVALSILYGAKWGSYTGLGLGMLADVMFGEVLGVRALSLYLIGYFVGEVMQNTSRNVLSGMLVCFAATFFHRGFLWLVDLLLRRPVSALWYLSGPIFIEALINALLFFVVLAVCKRVLKPATVQKYSGY